MATLALAAIGSAIGGTAMTGTILGMTGAQIGWMAGGMLGSYLFASDMGDQQGPRLEDVLVTTGAEGSDIPFVLGTHVVAGTIIAAADITEHVHEEDVGKGGGGGTYTSYTYTATFAISLGEFASKGPLKILLNKKPIFDETQRLDQATGETPVMTNETVTWHFYDGTQTEPSSLLEEIFGIGNVPAYTGQTIIIFEDVLLTEYGNRIPSVEVVISTEESKETSTVEHAFGAIIQDCFGITTMSRFSQGGQSCDYMCMEYSQATGLIYYMKATFGAEVDYIFLDFDPVTHDFTCHQLENTSLNVGWFSLFSSYGMSLGHNDKMVVAIIAEGENGWGIFDLATKELEHTFLKGGGTGYEPEFESSIPVVFETETHLHVILTVGDVYCYPKNNFDEWWYFDEDDLPTIYNYLPSQRTILTNNDSNNDTVTIIVFKSTNTEDVHLIDVTKTTLNIGHRWNISASNERPISIREGLGYDNLITGAGSITLEHGSTHRHYYDPQTGLIRMTVYISNSDYDGSSSNNYYIGLDPVTGIIEDIQWYGLKTLHGGVSSLGGPIPCFNRETRRISSSGNSWLQYYDIDTGFHQEALQLESPYNGPLAIYHAPTATFIGSQCARIADDDPYVRQTRIVNTPAEYSIGDMCEDLAIRAGIPVALIDKTGLESKTVPGFVHTRVTAARADIEPLLAYAQADAYIHNSKLSFKVRGGASEGVILYDDLGAKVGAFADDNPYTQSLQQSIDAPLYFTLKYLSIENDFQPGLALANHALSISKQHRSIGLPLLLLDDKAMEFIDKILQQDIEKGQIDFSLTEKHIEIEPTDIWVVTLEDERTVRVRIINVDTGADGLLKIKAVMDYAEHQVSHAIAGGATVTPSLISWTGDPQPYILDLPLLLDTESDQCSPYIAVKVSGETFPLIVVTRALSETNNFGEIATISSEVISGSTHNIPADIATFEEKDITSSLLVSLSNGTLATVTESEALNGANAFAWGQDGRFEICTFQTVVAEGSKTYTLTNLFRGRRGTHKHCNSHTVGDVFILLNTQTLVKDNLPVSLLGETVDYRLVPAGKVAADYEKHSHLTVNTALQPYAPVGLTVEEDNSIDQNLTLVAIARRRKNGSIGGTNNVTDGIGADPEVTGYRIEFYDVNDILRKTVDIDTTISYVYSKADQTTDYGVVPYTIKWRIAPISNLVLDVSVWSEWSVFTRPRVPTFNTSYDYFSISGDDITPRIYVTYPTGI